VSGLIAREAWAERELLERYTRHVERLLSRLLGDLHGELEDRVQETFVRVFERIDGLRDAECLPGFVTQIAINVGRETLRSRRRRRWLQFFAPSDLPEVDAATASSDQRDATRTLFRLLDRHEEQRRTIFCLRHLEGMELGEISAAASISIATVKRRLTEAEGFLHERMSESPDLAPWFARSTKWHPS